MATRNSVSRLIPGNPLGSILRETAREARRTSRRSTGTAGVEGATGPEGPEGPQGPQGPAGTTRTQYWSQVVTAPSGLVTWTFPAPFAAPPYVFAQVVDVNPHYWAVSPVTAASATITVWDQSGNFGAPGITVNVMAVSTV